MNKYTAEDFKNARFSEHPDGDMAFRCHPEETYAWETPNDWYTDTAMARDGWVPVPTVPGRTITESGVTEVFEASKSGRGGTRTALVRQGITVVPDPEPTNAERLADIYREWYGGDEVPNSLIQFMDQAGVTAPEEK